MSHSIEEAITYLLATSDRFYAEILLQMDRRWDKTIPTLGVSIGKRPIELVVNPDFWSRPEYTLQHKVFFLKHECAHLIADHGSRANGGFTPLHNVAADAAVHELIVPPKDLTLVLGDGTKGALTTVDSLLKQVPGLERNKPMEYYYEALKQAGQQGGDGMDDHKGLEAHSEAARATAREVVQRASDGCKQAGQAVPNELRGLVDDLLGSAVDWRRELRSFPDYAEVAYLESSRRIRNRRYGLQSPGHKKIRKVKIGVGFDVSGSIGDELAREIAGEIKNIVDGGAEVDVIFFDHAVQEVREWTENFLDKGVPGGGGTLFQPALDKAVALGCDGIIMLTDGMNADSITDPGIPVIWGILPEFKFEAPFGKVLSLTK